MKPKLVSYYNDLQFSPSESFLYKDFGQVAFTLAKVYDTSLEYWISAKNTNLDFKEFRGRKVFQFSKILRFLPGRLDFVNNLKLYLHALFTRDRVDYILAFPFTPLSDLLFLRILAWRFPAMKIILKLDTNREFLETIDAEWTQGRGSVRRLWRQSHQYAALLRIADLVICETTESEEILRRGMCGLDLNDKLVKTFSGISQSWFETLEVTGREVRRNSIIVSGRISSPQKFSELVFRAGPPPEGWRIEFIGHVDENLQRTIDEYRAQDDRFDDHYVFHGVINNKQDYFSVLGGCRALLMNSTGGEGFPNVYAEAHLCGLWIITSDVSGAFDATCAGAFGRIVPREDAPALRAALQELAGLGAEVPSGSEWEAYRRRFLWEHSLTQPKISELLDRRSSANAPGHLVTGSA